MKVPSVIPDIVAPAQLTAAADRVAPHFAPILDATAAGLIGFGHVKQHAGPFRFASRRPVVLIVGDDYDLSFGPAAFHAKSLRRFLRSAGSAVIVSGAPEPRVYVVAVAGAILSGRNVAIIESREAHEPAWIAAIRDAHPGLPTLVSTPGRHGEPLQ